MTVENENSDLIGQQGSRKSLNTPALVVDKAAMQRNIARMAAFAADKGLALRPHAKTHKSIDIAQLQIAAGARGICCAKLGEAEALAAAGSVPSILITSPVVSAPAIARLAKLHREADALMVVVDHPDNVRALAAAFDAEAPLDLLIDIDPGIHRTGVASPEATVDLAREIAKHSSLRFRGVQFYCGLQQHIQSYEERRAAIIERTEYLRSILEQLTDAGFAPEIVSGGGTGTHEIDAELGVLNELQVGSYVFMDNEYGACQLFDDAENFEPALLVDARIVSCNTSGMATVDAGFKALSTDGGTPVVMDGAPEGTGFIFMGDEHGGLLAANHAFEHGSMVTLQVPHCDPTVNLHDAYHVVDGDTVIDIWPVTARGRSR
ncbi:DSD1 family PLP-dependent enzyme [Parasphingopyxis sp.]|uniref:DSD1 family PLP-dependent enzyme n=1 Tax=Parasphingopyxis sp. TaxID=1920299 RepID=UPI0026286E4B|nr:DSD1 family PLP-dependent enzyme [Parasphingopyxis sp.]